MKVFWIWIEGMCVVCIEEEGNKRNEQFTKLTLVFCSGSFWYSEGDCRSGLPCTIINAMEWVRKKEIIEITFFACLLHTQLLWILVRCNILVDFIVQKRKNDLWRWLRVAGGSGRKEGCQKGMKITTMNKMAVLLAQVFLLSIKAKTSPLHFEIQGKKGK